MQFQRGGALRGRHSAGGHSTENIQRGGTQRGHSNGGHSAGGTQWGALSGGHSAGGTPLQRGGGGHGPKMPPLATGLGAVAFAPCTPESRGLGPRLKNIRILLL